MESLFYNAEVKEIWVKELTGGDWAICFFNDSDIDVPLHINWAHFYILSGEYNIHDIWNKSDLGTTKKEMEFTLGSHDAILLQLTKAR